MQRTDIISQLKNYFIQDVLDGQKLELDETTPLLEWGILNSFEMVRLLAFIRNQFHIDVSTEKMTADHFSNIATITDLIVDQE